MRTSSSPWYFARNLHAFAFTLISFSITSRKKMFFLNSSFVSTRALPCVFRDLAQSIIFPYLGIKISLSFRIFIYTYKYIYIHTYIYNHKHIKNNFIKYLFLTTFYLQCSLVKELVQALTPCPHPFLS